MKQQSLFDELFNAPEEKPASKEPPKPGEKPKEDPKPAAQKTSAWVPRMINGEWEIY